MRHVPHIPSPFMAIPVAVMLVTLTAPAHPAGLHRQKPSLLRLGSFSSALKPTEVVPAQQLIPKMHWGDRDSSGLQMGAYYNPQAHLIHCFIRNAGAHAVTINVYQFGCTGYIKVYARIAGTTQWTEVSDGICTHGVGPSARDNVIVQSGQYLIGEKMNLVYAGTAEHRTITQTECSFSARGITSRLPNPGRKSVELRVEHKLPNDGSRDGWQGTLVSAVLTVPAESFSPAPIGAP